MAIEERADDSAIEHIGKRFVVFFRNEFCNNFITFDATLDAQSFVVGGTTPKTTTRWSILIL